MTHKDIQLDAYKLLDLQPGATGDEIRQAYHKKLQEQPELFSQAYKCICSEKEREHYFWNSVHSYFFSIASEQNTSSLEEVIRELAFLSDWELGDLDHV
ncbi:MAG: hypothetical protein FJZ58_02270 [Chlamydiae bacterium]|nr:hypothetical protein [Chlamydiota bacterium]